MTKFSLFLLCICSLHASAQTDSLTAIQEITAFREKLNAEYKDRKHSPLDGDKFTNFKGHDFFPIDLDYRVEATLSVTEGTPFFAMKTTTSRYSTERIYGYVNFTLAGKEFRLPVYQSKDLMATSEYADYLFFPFTDETNGKETYGGRYIDLRIPKEGNDLVIDFNTAYNPYCAYSARFSCPLVPAENQMDIEVLAGIRYDVKEDNKTSGLMSPDSVIYTKVDVLPEYPGGYVEMMEFMRKNLTYPKSSRNKKIDGKVYVQFLVRPDGSITDVTTLRGFSEDFDAEAKRVISIMPKWKPGQHNGKNVFVKYVLPISFKRD